MKRSVLLMALASWAVFGSQALAQDYQFGVELDGVACGGTIVGQPGEQVKINAHLTIDASVGGAAAGWSMSLAGEGGGIVFGQELNARGGPLCAAPCIATLIFGPEAFSTDVFFHAPSIVDPTKNPDKGPLAGLGPQGPGIVVGTALDVQNQVTLPAGKAQVLPFFVTLTIPASGEETVNLSFKDGLQGPGDATLNGVAVGTETFPAGLNGCTITVKAQEVAPPDLLVLAPDGSNSISIEANPGEAATGVLYVAINSDRPSGEGVAGFQLSLSHGDAVDVTGADVASELLAATVDPLSPDRIFKVIQWAGSGLDPASPFTPRDPPDPECELTGGAAQGKGLVAGVLFSRQPDPSLQEYLPSDTNGPVRVIRVEFAQAVPFSSSSDAPQTASFEFKNCLHGTAANIKNKVTIGIDSINPGRQGLSVTFTPAQKSNFKRGKVAPGSGDNQSLTDVVFLIMYQFAGGPSPECLDAADVNADGRINIADPIKEISILFRSDTPIPPYATCGTTEASTSETCPPGSGVSCQ